MMKKKIQLGSMIALFLSGVLSAQSVGINTDTPNKSSVMHLAPFKGREAVIIPKVANGKVTGLTLKDGGVGYKTKPTLIIVGGGASLYSTGRRATATVTGFDAVKGTITAVSLTDGGNGYDGVIDPVVTVVTEDAKGWLPPRLDIKDVKNVNSPVVIPADDPYADGLLAYNSGTTRRNSLYWFNRKDSEWYEAADTSVTPKMAIYSFVNDFTTTGLHILSNRENIGSGLFKEPVSNIAELVKYDNGTTSAVRIPKRLGTYLVEVNLNLITDFTPGKNYPSNSDAPMSNNMSKAITADGYEYMGYYIDCIAGGGLKVKNSDTQNKFRKEGIVIAKVGAPHTFKMSFIVDVTDVSTAQNPHIHIQLGREENSRYRLQTKVLAKGSFIKIQQLK